jgi:hypothetical protein
MVVEDDFLIVDPLQVHDFPHNASELNYLEERNARVFRNTSAPITILLATIKGEARL